MVQLTYTQVIEIQEKQFEHYKKNLTQAAAFKLGNKLVAETGEPPCDPDMPVNSSVLHSLVPRGAWFEFPENVAIIVHGRKNRSFAPVCHPFKIREG